MASKKSITSIVKTQSAYLGTYEPYLAAHRYIVYRVPRLKLLDSGNGHRPSTASRAPTIVSSDL